MGGIAKLIVALALGLLALAGLGTAAASAAPRFDSYSASLSDTQAGGHPESYVRFRFDQEPRLENEAGFPGGEWVNVGGSFRNIVVDSPEGFYGNPQNFPTCPIEKLTFGGCPPDTQVGSIIVLFGRAAVTDQQGEEIENETSSFVNNAMYNMEPQRGEVARIGFRVAGTFNSLISVKLRPDDYRLEATTANVIDIHDVPMVRARLWGDPYNPVHDPERQCGSPTSRGCSIPISAGRPPFLVAPTQCSEAETTAIAADTWIDPENWTRAISEPQQMSGCSQVEFAPTIEAKPTTNLAEAPSGLDVKFHFPQNEDVEGLATAMLKDAVVTLPPGMTVNASSAAGLEACSMEQIGISPDRVPNGNPVTCPEASKIGTLSAVSPALENSLQGAVYLAKQDDNPFNSLLGLYFVVEDKERGILVKLAGEAKADPQTGQLTTIFRDNPQLPVEDLEVHLKQGPRAPLKTPASCGTFTTTSTLTPWTTPEGADATPSDSFVLAKGPSGGACPGAGSAAPNNPAFSAGTVDPTAGAYTPFVLRLARADGSQQLKAIDTTLPKGLLGKLAGTPYCSDANLATAAGKSGKAEQAAASCPAASQVGSVDIAAGAGSTPLYVTGKAYLAGPYKGAPLSLAVVTPATAGPFDLGTVVVRNALRVDPESAQIRAVSDPIPSILKGIPLNLRSIALKMDKPSFTLNPTSCDPMSVLGSATSVFDQAAALSNPFQVGDCGELGFKPKLAIRLKGGTKRAAYPALTATLTARPGDANIGYTSVALPHSEFLAQNHIKTICTRVQFAADQCPPGSIYGSARAFSPLLDKPLEGPVYLRSSANPLPDLVAALGGQIEIDLVGRIDSVRGGIRTTFEGVPDAPVSKFTLSMLGGKKGLLQNSRNLCRGTHKAAVRMQAQNGKQLEFSALVNNPCKKKAKKKKRRAGRG